jgi:hypothetical protein
MKRWIFNILCFLSFLLFICFLFLWIWTQSNELSLQRRFNSRKQDVLREYTFKLIAGRLILDFDVLAHSYTEPSGLYEIVQWSHRSTHASKPYSHFDYSIRPVTGTNLNGFDCLGLRYMRLSYALDRRISIFIPFSWLTLLSAVLPSMWLMRRLRRRQRTADVCFHCGYDLRATPQRCPECGAIADNSPSAARPLPLPPGHRFWKPLLIALSITLPLILIAQSLIPPQKPIWFEVYSAFHFIWPTCVLIGIAVAAALRPAGAGRKAIITSLIIFLLSLLVAAVPSIELYWPSDRLANAYTVHDFIFIGTRTHREASLFDGRPTVHGFAAAGFGSYAGTDATGQSERWTILHIWPITLASAILPASWLVRMYRARTQLATTGSSNPSMTSST